MGGKNPYIEETKFTPATKKYKITFIKDGQPIEVDPETAQILNYAATCHAESDGLFDITSGILRRAWRFNRDQPPDPEQVEMLLDRVGWHKVRWDPPVLSFPVPGMEIDFGGIVKEYAVDCAATLCKTEGIPNVTDPRLYINRELSLLSFQWRVLAESWDQNNPLLERFKFLSIVGSNLEKRQMSQFVPGVGRIGIICFRPVTF